MKQSEQHQKTDQSSAQDRQSGEQQHRADETVASLNAQAKRAEDQGRYEEAERLYQQVQKQQEQQLGTNHLDVALIYYKLGELYEKQGKYKDAERQYKRVLEIRLQLLGAMHLDTAQSLDTLGEFYKKQGKYKDAEPLFKRSQAIRKLL
jgi:tetratricopeptide (TPR) repeat protein